MSKAGTVRKTRVRRSKKGADKHIKMSPLPIGKVPPSGPKKPRKPTTP